MFLATTANHHYWDKNQKILFKHLTAKRPGYGIPPSDFKKIIGKKEKMKLLQDCCLCKKD